MASTPPSIPKTSRFPLWAKIVAGLLVVVGILAIAIPPFLNVDRYRDTIVTTLEKQTGRQVTLGKIRARFLPGIGFVVESLHISNPEGYPAGDLVSADEIRGNVAIRPLLHSEVHVNSLTLVHPRLNILVDSGGKNNYTFPSAPDTKAATSGEKSGMSLDRIDSVLLSDAEVMLGSVVKGAIVPFADTKGLNVTLNDFVVSPMVVKNLQATSKLSGVTVDLAGWSAPVAFHSGQIALAGGKIDAQFVADLAKASDIKGTMSVPDIDQPQVNFEMSASELDIDKLIAASGSGGGSLPSTPKSPEPAGKPGELVARGHINIERIISKPYTLGPANAELRAYTDRAELWPISVGMYGGTMQLSSRVDRVTNPARFTANVQIHNVDVSKVLEVSPTARGKMGGKGELEMQLLGSLNDAWKKSLSGSGKFAVRDGYLPGVNLGSATQSLGKLAGVGGNTTFSVLQGDLTIASQRVASKQIHLDSTTGIVDLRGNVGFDESLAYQGQIVVNPTEALGGSGSPLGGIVGGLIGARVGKITVPFALGGTIEKPKFEPGKGGVPSFTTPNTATGAPGVNGTSPAKLPTTPEDAVNTLRDLFKKH